MRSYYKPITIMTTKKQIQVAIVLSIKELPEYLYQYEASFLLRSRDLWDSHSPFMNNQQPARPEKKPLCAIGFSAVYQSRLLYKDVPNCALRCGAMDVSGNKLPVICLP